MSPSLHSRPTLAAIFAAACFAAAPTLFADDPKSAVPATTAPSATEIRQRFLALIDRPRVPLAPDIHETSSAGPLREFSLSFTAEPGQIVPGILVEPASPPAAGASARRPVIISLHGTGGRKEDERSFIRDCAARGFIGVAIDGRYHGERAIGVARIDNLNAYQSAIYRTWQAASTPTTAPAAPRPIEHPLFYDTVWDVMRLIDYLDTRDDVDPARIGVLGISKGGIEAYLAAAVDPRIAAAVPCISVESFEWALDNDMWQHRVETFQGAFDLAARNAGASNKDPAFVRRFYDAVMPGITSAFDGPSITPLIAPRPLMLINGELDPRTPPASLKLCTDALKAAYHTAHADDHLQILIQPSTAHQVRPASRTAAIDFFAKWLKPQ